MELRVERDQSGKASVVGVPDSPVVGFTHTDIKLGFMIARRIPLLNIAEADKNALEAGDTSVTDKLIQRNPDAPSVIEFTGCIAMFPIRDRHGLMVDSVQEVTPYIPLEA